MRLTPRGGSLCHAEGQRAYEVRKGRLGAGVGQGSSVQRVGDSGDLAWVSQGLGAGSGLGNGRTLPGKGQILLHKTAHVPRGNRMEGSRARIHPAAAAAALEGASVNVHRESHFLFSENH